MVSERREERPLMRAPVLLTPRARRRHGRLAIAMMICVVLATPLAIRAGNLLNSDGVQMTSANCTVASSLTDTGEQKADVSVTGDGIAFLQWNFPDVAGPAVATFRMKTNAHGDYGEYLMYWVVDGDNDWRHFRRIPFHADGEWHAYRIPLSAAGAIKALRVTLGPQAHQAEVSDLRVVSLDDAPASTLPHVTPAQVRAGPLACEFDAASRRFVIVDDTANRTWQSEPLSAWLRVEAVHASSDTEMQLQLLDRFADHPLTATISVSSTSVTFELLPTQPDAPLDAVADFPPRFSSNYDQGHFVFCDRSCGVLLAQTDDTYASWPLRVYGNTNCLDMPWIGLYDGKHGDGMMLLIETPADAEVALTPDSAGLHWPEVRWLPALDRFGYPRRASYRFVSEGGYVSLAKLYRAYLREQGRLKTLSEKSRLKPNVERLKGAPSLWGGRYPTKFIRQVWPLGIRRGIISTCKEPGIVAWLNDLGFLTGIYDGYTDFVEGEIDFHRDSVTDAAVISRPGGDPKHGWKLRGGAQMYWRSSARWQQAADAYVDRDVERYGHNTRFVDVGAAAELLEDYHPQHTMDRRQDLANRRALYEDLNRRQLVLGTEHGNDWVVDLVEYIEGTMSGPFWWSAWPAGYLDVPTRDQLTPEYLEFGMGYAHRVPLWELVYHDCALTTWYWGDTAGILFQNAPELADQKDLFNILYGTTPLIWMNDAGYQTSSQLHRLLKTFHDTCPLHEVVAFSEMTDHSFLTDDRSVQRTRFSNGTEITVNFSLEPRLMETSAGQPHTLASLGYHVAGPGFHQTRLQVGEDTQTVISKPGYLTVEASGTEEVEGVRCKGRVTLFRESDSRWNLFMSPSTDCELDVARLTGWDPAQTIRACFMDDIGERQRDVGTADAEGRLRLQSSENAWRFVLLRDHPTPKDGTPTDDATDQPNALSESERNAGFQLLFNGRDLEDWHHAGNWTVEDGAIFRKEGGGALAYAPRPIPDNFELRFEWKVAPGSNSGVYYRPTQYEYQILDNEQHNDGKNPRTSAASLYFCVAPSKDVTRPAGEWNSARIIAHGTIVQHWLNGEKVVHLDYTDPARSHEIDLLRQRGGDLTARGAHLNLQDHNDPVWYRSIKLRTLPEDAVVDRTPVSPAAIPAEALAHEQEILRIIQQRRDAKAQQDQDQDTP